VKLRLGLLGMVIAVFAAPTVASAATTATRDANAVAGAFVQGAPSGSAVGAEFTVIPPNGNPAAVSNSQLASFPLNGSDFGILSSGDAAAAEAPDSGESRSSNNGGGSGGHGNVNDVATLRVDLAVPENRNCLTFDFRFLSEEYPEFLGSQFNDGFVAEIDGSNFSVDSSGDVSAPLNIAQDENGKVVTINTTGTSSDNAIGTTYDGATPILTGSTPISAGAHSLYLSIYDASDSILDSSVFIDNLRLLNEDPTKCKRGAAPTPDSGIRCKGEEATVIASDGVATGTEKADVIVGTSDDDEIRGRGGNDLICGRGGDDDIDGNGGEDDISGNDGNDTIRGNTDDDSLGGGIGEDALVGQRGNDLLRGGSGDDRLRGNGGDDDIRGHKDDDALHGNAGDDALRGNGGDNECVGGSGDNSFGVGC
jgi:Ca2+-binding RTX toxin-like protein